MYKFVGIGFTGKTDEIPPSITNTLKQSKIAMQQLFVSAEIICAFVCCADL